jgi:putative MATE family efflux protein
LSHHPKKVEDDTREEILTLGIWQLFKKLAIPAIIGMLMYAIYIFIDAIFVGQWVGPNGLAAITVVYPLTLVNLAIASFMGVGSASILSRAIGAKDKETVDKILGNNTLFVLLFSMIYAAIGFLFAEQLIGFMGASDEILNFGVAYFKIVVMGSFFINFIGSSIMLIEAEGRPKAAMIIITCGSVFNIILDPIFIRVLDMGISGAAIATVLAMVFTCIISFMFFIRSDGELKFTKKGFRFSPQLMKELAPVGASGMFMQLLVVTEQIMIFKSIVAYNGGPRELAIIGATLNMLSFALIPMFGITQGMQPVIGINYGAKEYARVKETFKKFLMAATFISTVIWIIFMTIPDKIIGIYLTDPSLVDSGTNIFRIVMVVFFLQGMIFLPATLFQSMGKGGKAGLLLLIRQVVLFVPLIIILPILMGLDGVWWSIPLADGIAVAIISIFVLRGLKSIGKDEPEKDDEGETELDGPESKNDGIIVE